MLQFEVPGVPRGKGRPRLGRGHAYTDPKTRAHEAEIARRALIEMRCAVTGRGRLRHSPYPLEGPLSLTLLAYFPRPKRDPVRCFDMGRIDLDNIVKTFLDGLQNAGAMRNDSQVVHIEAWRLCAVVPCVSVTLRSASQLLRPARSIYAETQEVIP